MVQFLTVNGTWTFSFLTGVKITIGAVKRKFEMEGTPDSPMDQEYIRLVVPSHPHIHPFFLSLFLFDFQTRFFALTQICLFFSYVSSVSLSARSFIIAFCLFSKLSLFFFILSSTCIRKCLRFTIIIRRTSFFIVVKERELNWRYKVRNFFFYSLIGRSLINLNISNRGCLNV